MEKIILLLFLFNLNCVVSLKNIKEFRNNENLDYNQILTGKIQNKILYNNLALDDDNIKPIGNCLFLIIILVNSNKTVNKYANFLSLKSRLLNHNKFSDFDGGKIINNIGENYDNNINNSDKKKYKKFNLELTQTKLKMSNETKTISNRKEKYLKEKRLTRMLWVSAIVLALTFFCIIYMKTAIDLANNSKAAINNLKDMKAKEIVVRLQKQNNILSDNLIESGE